MNKPEILIRIPSSLLSQIKKDLNKPHAFAFERIGFISSTHKLLKNGNIIICMFAYRHIPDDQYIDDQEVGARINSNAIRESLQGILDTKNGCFHAHCHQSSIKPEFSTIDLEDNPEIIKSFSYADGSQVHGMILFGKEKINALVKLPGESTLRKVDKIVVVGSPLAFSFPCQVRLNLSTKRYNRQSFLGINSQSILSQIKIGVIGLGGGGSHIVQQLAHLGVKNYVLFDYDIVDETNLNRLIGASLLDIKTKTKKTVVASRIINQLHLDAKINAIEDDWLNDPESLQECDIVFGCVDSYLARRDIESECRRYLIPYIDIGMDVYNDYKSEAPNIVGQVILSMPGNHCMHCMRFLTDENLTKEAAKYGAAGGRPQVVWPNGILASQAIGIFVDLITGWTGIKDITPYYSYDGNIGILINHPRLKYVTGICEHYKIQDVGIPKFKKI